MKEITITYDDIKKVKSAVRRKVNERSAKWQKNLDNSLRSKHYNDAAENANMIMASECLLNDVLFQIEEWFFCMENGIEVENESNHN